MIANFMYQLGHGVYKYFINCDSEFVRGYFWLKRSRADELSQVGVLQSERVDETRMTDRPDEENIPKTFLLGCWLAFDFGFGFGLFVYLFVLSFPQTGTEHWVLSLPPHPEDPVTLSRHICNFKNAHSLSLFR